MTTKERKNKTTSFKLNDSYEARLLAWAESAEKGDYSKYVKRLISRDMDDAERPRATVYNQPMVQVVEEEEDYSGYV